jgi:hypothetical protein
MAVRPCIHTGGLRREPLQHLVAAGRWAPTFKPSHHHTAMYDLFL